MVYDVIVSGAGPSGSYSAYLCAKRGLRTLLVEKERMPRNKCCGGGILRRALNKLEFEIPGSLVEKIIAGAAIIGEGSRNEIRSRTPIAITVRRERLDAFLAKKAEAAGAEVREGVVVEAVSEDGEGVSISLRDGDIAAKALILAEGINSQAAKKLMGPYEKRSAAMGMSLYCDLRNDPGNLMEFYFFNDAKRRGNHGYLPPLYGYGWMFPYSEGANIGAGGAGLPRAFMSEKIEEIMGSNAERCGGLESRGEIIAHPLPLSVRRSLHSRRAVAVGDAGGLANPITGEGMTYCFASASFAAESVARLVESGNSSCLADYERKCRETMVRDFRAASFVQRTIRSILGTIDLDTFLGNLCGSEALIAACFGIVDGTNDWTLLSRRALVKAPALYFSSIRGKS